MIIGLTGVARCGKTTAAHLLETMAGYKHYSFAAPIRRTICDILGVTLEEMEVIKEDPHPLLGGKSPRYAMQTLGTEWGRDTIYKNMWVDSCIEKAIKADNAVISDTRFNNEAESIILRGGHVIEIVRPGAATTIHSGHASEQGIDPKFISTKILNNGSLDALYEKLKSYIYGNELNTYIN